MLSTGLPDQTISTAGAISLGAKEYLEFSLCRAHGIGFPYWTSSPTGEGELRKKNTVFFYCWTGLLGIQRIDFFESSLCWWGGR